MYVLLWLNTMVAVQMFFIKRIFVFFTALFLTMLPRKNRFTQFSLRMAAWLLLAFFICLHSIESKNDSLNRQ